LSSEPTPSPIIGRQRRPNASVAVQKWSRWIHVYTSMICLLLVLFFSLTGITLNHPTWGAKTHRSTASGIMPAAWRPGPTVDWFVASEHLRSANGVTGLVSDTRSEGGESSITFKGPGLTATATIDDATGTYNLDTEAEGLVGVMNDIHKGRNTTSSWKWVIDVIAGFLVLISLSGLLLQFFLKKRRTSAYVTAGVGVVIGLILMYLSVG
jgi:uncharacterized protein